MYSNIITVCCYNAAMKYFGSVEAVFLIHWGIFPILKGLQFERVHAEGNIIFIDNRKLSSNRHTRHFKRTISSISDRNQAFSSMAKFY